MNICILGCTGSIGRQTFEVLQNIKDIKVCALAAAGNNLDELKRQAQILKPSVTAVYNETGMDGLLECVTLPEVDLVVNAMVGGIGLQPTMAAIAAKKHIALANKETLVAAGSLVMEAARQNKVKILPIDSEHSAIWQCLAGESTQYVKRLILTASGGAFRDWSKAEIEKSTAADALRHPNWNMGKKITIDCATMMNKGLEYIEAHWLFNTPYEKIDILVHPQSIIHSMVEFEDGAVMAQMGAADMRQPIQYALTGERLARLHSPLDFLKQDLTFSKPDLDRFPCLRLAMEAAKIGGTMPAMMNALNEHLVEAFLQNKIRFYDIPRLIEKAMGSYTVESVESLADVYESESWANEYWRKIACQL